MENGSLTTVTNKWSEADIVEAIDGWREILISYGVTIETLDSAELELVNYKQKQGGSVYIQNNSISDEKVAEILLDMRKNNTPTIVEREILKNQYWDTRNRAKIGDKNIPHPSDPKISGKTINLKIAIGQISVGTDFKPVDTIYIKDVKFQGAQAIVSHSSKDNLKDVYPFIASHID